MVWCSHQENSSTGLIDTIISEPTAQRGLFLKSCRKIAGFGWNCIESHKVCTLDQGKDPTLACGAESLHSQRQHIFYPAHGAGDKHISSSVSHQVPSLFISLKHWSQGHALQGQISSDAASSVIHSSWRSSCFTKQHNHQFSTLLTFRPLSTKVSVYQVMKLQV